MSDAPERIWLTNFVKDQYGARLGRGTISDLDHGSTPDYPEYIRADVAEAMVAAALREAADVAGHFYAKGQTTLPRDITALIPDGGKALDRYVKERSDEALAAERERCAKVVEVEGMYYAGLREGTILDRVAAAIRHGSAIRAQGDKK